MLPLDRAKRLDGEPRRAKHHHLLDVAQGVERPAARAEEIEMRLVVPPKLAARMNLVVSRVASRRSLSALMPSSASCSTLAPSNAK